MIILIHETKFYSSIQYGAFSVMSDNIKIFIINKNLNTLQCIGQILGTISGVEVIGSVDSFDNEALSGISESDLILLDIEVIEKADKPMDAKVGEYLSKVVATNCHCQNGTFVYPKAEGLGIKYFLPDLGDDQKHHNSFRVQLLTIIGRLRSQKYFKVQEKDIRALNSHKSEDESAVCDDRKSEPTRSKLNIPGANVQKTAIPHVLTINIVVIACSTGGPKSLEHVIPQLPRKLGVPVLLVQHMPSHSTEFLLNAMKKLSDINVTVATDGEEIHPDTVYLAPGGKHMYVKKNRPEMAGGMKKIGLNENPPENSVRPSADVLFRSVADEYGGNILAVIMTGMGKDGLEGVKYMKQKGCYCLSQTQESCVVYGMSRSIDDAGLADEKVDLKDLARRITHLVKERKLIKK